VKHFLKKHFLLLLLLSAALALRIFLASFLMQPHFNVNDDSMRYQDWGRIAYHHGLSETYQTMQLSFGSNPNNQPPGTVYIDLAMYSLQQVLFQSPPEKSPLLYAFFLKLPNILADVLIGVMIYYCVLRNTKRKYALIANSLFLFNPVVIYNSAIWGQTDALNNFFFFASLTFLFGKKYFLSLLLFFLSLFIKLSVLPLLPFLLIILFLKMKFQYLKLFMYLCLSIGLILILTLPVNSNPLTWWIQFFTRYASGELPYITNYTFNFWSILFNPDSFALVPLSSDLFWGLPLAIWGYLLFGIVVIPLIIYLIKQKNLDDAQILLILSLAAFAVFLFLPRMHQRYIYPALPLLATFIGLKRKHYLPYILLSLVNFINLYVVWHPGDFLPVFLTNIIAHSKIRLGMSILVVGIFLVLYSKTLKKKLLHFF
jgi:Gpi18-like mannosyltransferase